MGLAANLYDPAISRMPAAVGPLAVTLAVAAVMVSGCGAATRQAGDPQTTAAAAGTVTTSSAPSSPCHAVFCPASPVPVDPPDTNLVNAPAVASAKASVVKVRAVAHSCRKVFEGTGFVVAPHRVMATAHSVAGSDSVSVQVDGEEYFAQVVSTDPEADIAVLSVPNLATQPLPLADTAAQRVSTAGEVPRPDGRVRRSGAHR